MSNSETTDLLARMQAEADTWSVEEPERALWMEAKAEIARLETEREILRQRGVPLAQRGDQARPCWMAGKERTCRMKRRSQIPWTRNGAAWPATANFALAP